MFLIAWIFFFFFWKINIHMYVVTSYVCTLSFRYFTTSKSYFLLQNFLPAKKKKKMYPKFYLAWTILRWPKNTLIYAWGKTKRHRNFSYVFIVIIIIIVVVFAVVWKSSVLGLFIYIICVFHWNSFLPSVTPQRIECLFLNIFWLLKY